MDDPPTQYAIANDGVRVAYVRYPGTSPAFLVVNTPGAPPLPVRALMPAYAAYYPPFLRGRAGVHFDWRGSGHSEAFVAPLRIEDLVADIDAVTAAIGEPVDADFLGRASFAGFLHAAACPERYRSIRVVGGSVRFGQTWQGVYNRPGWDRNYGEHLRGLARNYFDVSPEEALRLGSLWERTVPHEVFAAYLGTEREVDLTELLPRIQVPVWVTARQPIDYEPAAVLASLLPNATLSTYEPYANRGAQTGDFERDEWDRHLGARLGDPPSSPVAAVTPTEGPRNPADLSPRELEVLHLVAAGDTNKQIAASLDIAPGTVARHVSNILKKTGLENRRQLMRYADEHYPSA